MVTPVLRPSAAKDGGGLRPNEATTPKAAPTLIAESSGAERIGDQRMGRNGRAAALQDKGHAFDDAAAARFDRIVIGEFSFETGDRPIEVSVGAAALVDLVQGPRPTNQGHVCIARSTSRQITLPEPSQIAVERALAEQARAIGDSST